MPRKDEDKFYGRVDFEQVIYLQILKIGDLSSRIFNTPETDEWQKNALNYYYAVRMLEALLYPYLDKKYYEAVEEIEKKAKEKYEKRQDGGSEEYATENLYLDVKDTIEVTNEIIRLISERMKKLGLLIPKQTWFEYGKVDVDTEHI